MKEGDTCNNAITGNHTSVRISTHKTKFHLKRPRLHWDISIILGNNPSKGGEGKNDILLDSIIKGEHKTTVVSPVMQDDLAFLYQVFIKTGFKRHICCELKFRTPLPKTRQITGLLTSNKFCFLSFFTGELNLVRYCTSYKPSDLKYLCRIYC